MKTTLLTILIITSAAVADAGTVTGTIERYVIDNSYTDTWTRIRVAGQSHWVQGDHLGSVVERLYNNQSKAVFTFDNSTGDITRIRLNTPNINQVAVDNEFNIELSRIISFLVGALSMTAFCGAWVKGVTV